jgi:hypothetical protein
LRRLFRVPYRCRWRSRLAIGKLCPRPIGQFRVDERKLRTEHRFFIARRLRRDLIGVRRGLHPGDELIAVVSPKRCPRTSCELRVDERQLGADHLERFRAGGRPRAAIGQTQRRRLRSRRGHDRHRSRAYPRVSRGLTGTTAKPHAALELLPLLGVQVVDLPKQLLVRRLVCEAIADQLLASKHSLELAIAHWRKRAGRLAAFADLCGAGLGPTTRKTSRRVIPGSPN